MHKLVTPENLRFLTTYNYIEDVKRVYQQIRRDATIEIVPRLTLKLLRPTCKLQLPFEVEVKAACGVKNCTKLALRNGWLLVFFFFACLFVLYNYSVHFPEGKPSFFPSFHLC